MNKLKTFLKSLWPTFGYKNDGQGTTTVTCSWGCLILIVLTLILVLLGIASLFEGV